MHPALPVTTSLSEAAEASFISGTKRQTLRGSMFRLSAVSVLVLLSLEGTSAEPVAGRTQQQTVSVQLAWNGSEPAVEGKCVWVCVVRGACVPQQQLLFFPFIVS